MPRQNLSNNNDLTKFDTLQVISERKKYDVSFYDFR